MSEKYQAISWNRQKKIYDALLWSGVVVYLLLFIGLGSILQPNATIETLLIRGFGTCAILLLHNRTVMQNFAAIFAASL
jgi:hypothetical protein